jgi:chemotaxis protein methyltransferase CheR
MLRRAHNACFARTSLRELPHSIAEKAFDQSGQLYHLKPQYREGIRFLHQDLRLEAPDGPFDLILCRYVAFTYFAPPLQEEVLRRFLERLSPNSYLAIGADERLPSEPPTLAPLSSYAPQIFKKSLREPAAF